MARIGVIHTKARPHFDLDLKFGQQKENELQEILHNEQIECKTDKICKRTGNVFVEFEEQSRIEGDIQQMPDDFEVSRCTGYLSRFH